MAMQTILIDTERYHANCTMQTPFHTHFAYVTTQTTFTTEDAFMLLEDILIFVREVSLRTGAHILPAEKYILNWAEQEAEWHAGDGTIFSEFYYILIPVRVLHDLTTFATPLFSSPLCDYGTSC